MTIKEFVGLRLHINEERRTLSCALLLLAAVLLRQDAPVKGCINCACLPAEQGENSLRMLWEPADGTENAPGGSGNGRYFSLC